MSRTYAFIVHITGFITCIRGKIFRGYRMVIVAYNASSFDGEVSWMVRGMMTFGV